MRNVLAMARKELSIYFTTPRAYVMFAAMVGLSAFFFVADLEAFQTVQTWARMRGWASLGPGASDFKNLTDGVIVQLWRVVVIITLFMAPFLSMRLFAEERRHKTFELLMTAPLRPWEIVLGKYLGGVGITVATLGMTIFFPIVLALFGSSESGSALEWSTVLLGYAGLLLWGATCIAIGMFISALTESQMLAAALTFAVLLPWMLLRGVAQTADEPLRTILSHLSFDMQLQGMLKGALELKAVVLFVSVILLSLVLTHRTVEAQRWA